MGKRKRVERSKKKKERLIKGESFEHIHTQTYTDRKKNFQHSEHLFQYIQD